METIKSGAEISRLFKEGRRIGTKDLTLIALKNEEQHGHGGRAAFIAGKKLGNAVWRNRAKRRMRAVCKDIEGPFEGYDVIFLAKKSINKVPYQDLVKSLKHAVSRNDYIHHTENS